MCNQHTALLVLIGKLFLHLGGTVLVVSKETILESALIHLVDIASDAINCGLEGAVGALPDKTIAIVNNEDLHFGDTMSILNLLNPFSDKFGKRI